MISIKDKLINAGMYQIAYYKGLITNMFRVGKYMSAGKFELARYYGEKAQDNIKRLSEINQTIYDELGEHIFYTGC